MWRNNVAKYQIVNSPIVNMNYIYELPMKVRDYECDLQGIVNNANYQHYLEHTRHEFLLSAGVSFAGLHEQGVDPVVARINMAFKTPLRSGDEFVSKLYMKKEGIKYVFYQDIFRASDGKVCLKGIVETVCVVNGRLSDSELFDRLFAPYLNPCESVKYVFYQDIFRESDNKVAIKAVVETVGVVNGRLSDSELFDNVFAPYLDHE